MVIGGSGFIGSHFIDHMISKDFRIINVDKISYASNLDYCKSSSKMTFYKIDITSYRAINELIYKIKPHIIVNFAAESHVDRSIDSPGEFIQTNIFGTYVLLEQSRIYWSKLKESKKNMFLMSILLVVVNVIFLTLGALLFIYAEQFNIAIPELNGVTRTDLLFPEIAMNQGLGKGLAITFIIGLIAAAYSSADSALTSLTTSFSVDFCHIENQPIAVQKPLRKKVHVGVSVVLIVVVIIFN